MIKVRYSILAVFLLLLSFSYGQTEAEMKLQADKLFDSEQYLEATPLYLRLLSLQPRDANYNYRYGTCLIYNSSHKPDAIKYLSFAVTDPNMVPDAYYYLGKALHYNYQFNDAIKNFTIYTEKKAKAVNQFDAEHEIIMCQNGKRLMTTISDLIVTEKKEITSDKFFRIFDLSGIGGSLLVTTEFQSKLDKKNNHTPLIHFPQNPSVIYYSSYGEDGKNGKDIYLRRKLPDGSWGIPQLVQGGVNTKYDEDFPYMHPDGNYLYFSSKGHNSMGGYDVFRSKFDADNNSFGPPENMDFAISSPDDDLFYIVDSLNVNAYFASARQSRTGMLNVYKVMVDRVPLQLAVVKGNFVSEIDPTNKKINFEIKDYANGELIGKFNSNEKAVYLITFPKGGKYEYIMRIDGVDKEFRSVVSIPFLKEFKPLKQKIVHLEEEGKEVVKIINLFNEEVEDPQAVIAEVIKMRSELNVNVQEFDMEELEADRKNKEVLAELGMGELLMTEVSSRLKDEVEKSKENKKEAEKIKNNIHALVVQNKEDFIRLEDQIKNKVAEASKTENINKKYLLLKESEQLIRTQNELKQSSKDMLRLADSITQVINASSNAGKIDQLNQVAKRFDELYRAGNEKEALAYLAENKELVRDALNDNSTELKGNLVERVVKLDDELRGLNTKIDQLNRDQKELEVGIQFLENSKYTAKKKDLVGIDASIVAKKEELAMIASEKKRLENKVDELTAEKYQINRQIAMITEALSNTTSEVVSREGANQSVKETDKINTNTLNAYVEQQIVELEKQDPTLKERINVTSGMKADNILSEHKTIEKRIQENKALSRLEQLNKLVANAENTKRALENRLKDIEAQLEKNKFDENLNKEKQQLLRSIALIDQEIIGYESALNKEGEPSDIVSKEREELEKEIDPEYEEKRAALLANAQLNEKERLGQEQLLDQQFIDQVNTELARTEQKLQQNPNDPALNKKQDVLKEIKQNKETVVAERGKSIANINTEAPTLFTSEKVLSQVDPEFSIRIKNIQSNNALTELKKTENILAEEQELLGKIDQRISVVQNLLKSDPSNKALVAELKALEELKAETLSAIQENSNTIMRLENEQSRAITKENVLTKLDNGYNDRIDRIQNNTNLSEKERLVSIQKEEEALLAKIDSEIAAVAKRLESDPGNAGLASEMKVLNELRSDTNSSIESKQQKIAALENTQSNVLTKLDNEHNDRIDRIQNNTDLSEKERLVSLQKEEEALLAKIDSEIAAVAKRLESDPGNAGLASEMKVLNELRSDTNSSIESKQQKIAALENAQSNDVNQAEIISNLDNNYQKRIDQILQDQTLTKKEQLVQLQKEDKQLIQLIQERIEEIETSYPEKISELEALRNLKEDKETEIAAREKELENLSSEIKSMTLLTQEVAPNYSEEIKAIQENKRLTEQEKLAQTQLKDKELVNEINESIKRSEDKIQSNPKDLKEIDRKEQLNELKAIVEERIEERDQLLENQATSQLTQEQIAQEKTAILTSVDPTYVEKKEQLLKKEPLPSYPELIALEEKLLTKLEVEKKSIEKKLAKDPFNKDAVLKLKLLEQLIGETKAEKARWEELLNGPIEPQVLLVTAAEKQKLVQDIEPEYEANKENLLETTNTDPLALSKEIELEESLRDAIRERVVANKNVLADDPENTALKRELEILSELKKDNEARLIELQKVQESLQVAERTFTNQELISKINSIDPLYETTVEGINTDTNLSAQKKKEELVLVEQALLNKVLDALDEVERNLENNPGSRQLQEETQLLEKAVLRIEQQIAQLEQEIAAGSSESPLMKGATQDWIDQIDPSYQNDVKFIQENESFDAKKKLELIQQKDLALLSKIEQRLEAISKIPDPKLPEFNQEEKNLLGLQEELLSQTSARKEEIEKLDALTVVNAPDRGELVESLLPDYARTKETIENDEDLSAYAKRGELIALEEALQQKTEYRLVEIEKLIASEPANKGYLLEQDILKEILESTIARVQVLKSSELQTTETKEKVIAAILPDYESRKMDLNNSKMEESKKVSELNKLEKELLTNLLTEQKTVQKQLDKDPSNVQLQQRAELLPEMITEQQEVISELENRKAILAKDLIAQNALKNADKTYVAEIQELNAQADSPEKTQAIVDREEVHQERLAAQIEANEKSLEKKENKELVLVNQLLKEELQQSTERIMQLKETVNPEIETKKQQAYLNNLREDLLAGAGNQLEAKHTDVNALKEQEAVLAQYEMDLYTQITEKEKEAKKSPEDLALQEEISWLKEEMAFVKNKRREVNVSIGELETELIVEKTTESKISSPELMKLEQQEALLQQQMNNTNLTTAERKQLDKELQVNQEKQLTTENALLATLEKSQEVENKEGLAEIQRLAQERNSVELKIAEKQVQSELNAAKTLTEDALETKNTAEKNYLLNAATEKQEDAQAVIKNALYEQELKRIEEEYGLTSLETRSDLEKKKRRFSVDAGELTTEIISLEKEISTADKKEVVALQQQKTAKEDQLNLINKEIAAIDNKLATLPSYEPTLDPNSKNVVMSYNDERDIASKDEYKNYVEKVNEALRAEEQMLNLEKQLSDARLQTKLLAAEKLENPSAENIEALKVSADLVQQLERELATQRVDLTQKQAVAQAALPQNTNEAMMMQNLVRRGIAPISKIAVAAALVQMPTNGLSINANGASLYTEANPIPVDVTNPKGLVYRVQVGAFAKPITQDKFKEFNPVSGEKLNNGITRYMAGFFNNSTKALDAMKQIRLLGYADAFPVAYCDGRRITLDEARRLESSGECVPKGESELIMEIAANTAVKMGLEDTLKLKKVQEYTYNQAPGAAKADPIEARKGLFFTVQIGVYNKPVPSATLFNLEPYMSLRLPNGQIRYTTGIFHSVDEARPLKQQAIDKGVKDAFITAYYNGERIAINDAVIMLGERGESVLEPKVKPVNGEVIEPVNPPINTGQVTYTPTVMPEIVPVKPIEYLQIVTKKTFTEFPVEVLNRYNSHGSFYFDVTDGKVKSAVANSEEDLPQVFYFREDIDTLHFNSALEFTKGTILSLTFAEGKLPGDVIDWLLRLNYRKEYLQSEEGITLLIHDVPEELREQIDKEAAVFGISFSALAPKVEEEVQENK